MTSFPFALLTTFTILSAAQAQDLIHYKFAAGGGNKVVNYGTSNSMIPRQGTIQVVMTTPVSKAWGQGRFGGGLIAGADPSRGYEVDTGWRPRIQGDATVSFFIRMVHQLPVGEGFILGPSDSEIYLSMLGNTATRGWLYLSWGNRRYTLQVNVFDLAAKGWVHVAFTVDIKNKSLRWYINGQTLLPVSIPTWGRVEGDKNLTILDTGRSFFAFDEFRLLGRVASSAEIASWATKEPAAHAPFGKACHPLGRSVLLDGTSGGRPVIGNSNYRLTLYGLPGSVVALGMGSNNQVFGGAPLPLDLKILTPQLSGCFLRTSGDLVRFGRIGSTGALSFALPIPNLPAASGAKLYSQALLDSSILKTTMMSNAYSTVVGN